MSLNGKLWVARCVAASRVCVCICAVVVAKKSSRGGLITAMLKRCVLM